MELNNFDDIIKNSKKIMIISHVNPDGDTLGSMCALYQAIYLRHKIKPDMHVLSNIPSNYTFLPFIQNAKRNFDKSLLYDLVITVDVASKERLCDSTIFFDKAKTTVNFDHHKTNNGFGDYSLIMPTASSTGEVLFKFFKDNNWKIDYDMAVCLYVAIMTDTGNFRFENTTSDTFRIAGDLMDLGINPNSLYKKCYETKSKDLVMFQNYCVNKAVFSEDKKIVYTTVYKKDLEKFHGGDDFTDGISETLRSIDTTDVSFVVKEVDSKTSKISMRSKKTDVAKICAIFNGGGHTFAAGCTIKNDVETSVKKLLNEIEKETKKSA